MPALNDFLNSLKPIEKPDALLQFCRKNVLHGTPHVFRSREDEFYEFRRRISDQFDVAFHDVFITGSAKLGFSPHKRTEFDLESDLSPNFHPV